MKAREYHVMATELAPTSLPVQETGVIGWREITIEDTTILTGDLHHPDWQTEEPIEIETAKVIDRLAMVVEAEVEVHEGLDRHILEDHLAKKLYWKGYRWIW